MTGIMGRYLKYNFKKSIIRLIIMASVAGVMGYYTSASGQTNYWSDTHAVTYSSLMTLVSVFFMFYSFLFAGMEFAPFKNRRNIDLWFSSPLARNQILGTGIINGFIQLAITMAVAFICAAAKMAVLNSEGARFRIYLLIPMFAVMLVAIGFIYLLNCFLFITANSVFDGAVYLIFFHCLPPMLYSCIQHLAGPNDFGIVNRFDKYSFLSTPLALPIMYSSMFDNNMVAQGRNGIALLANMQKDEFTVLMIATVFWVAVCLTAGYFAFRVFGNLQSEKLGAPSDLLFGYRILIPAWGFMMIYINMDNIWVVPFFNLVGMFVAYIIFRKGVKLKKPDVIILIVAALFAIVTQSISIASGNNAFVQLMNILR